MFCSPLTQTAWLSQKRRLADSNCWNIRLAARSRDRRRLILAAAIAAVGAVVGLIALFGAGGDWR